MPLKKQEKKIKQLKKIGMQCSILIFSLGMLTACGKEKTSSTTNAGAVKGSSFQQSFHNAQLMELGNMGCETAEGTYFLLEYKLWFLDQGAEKMILVCAKPECNHENEGCNGKLNVAMSLDAYEDKLYYYGTDENGTCSLFSVEKDGEGKTKVQTLNPKGLMLCELRRTFVLIREEEGEPYVYYNSLGSIYKAKLGQDYEQATLVAGTGKTDYKNMDLVDCTVWEMWLDDELYLMADRTQKGQMTQTLYVISENGALTEYWNQKDASEMAKKEDAQIGGWYITNGKLYYHIKGDGIWAYDFAKKEAASFISFGDEQEEEPGVVNFDKDYIYVLNKDYMWGNFLGDMETEVKAPVIQVFDWAGKLICTKESEGMEEVEQYFKFSLLGSGEKELFFGAYLEEKQGTPDVYGLSKEDIKTAQWRKIK